MSADHDVPPQDNGEPGPDDPAVVLVVDDEPAVRRVVGRLLRMGGFRTVEAESGAEALERAAEHRIHVLLTDIMMPGMEGTVLAQHFRTRHPGIPVVLMSGHLEESDAAALVGTVAERFVAKPFEAREIIRTIRELVERDG